MTNLLPVVEQFHSLQGEGFHTGKSAYFIRLAGCDVGCKWCDTKHSWPMDKYPLYSLKSLLLKIKQAQSKGASFLVITGGEPLHHNLDQFCSIIKNKTLNNHKESIRIHIETSGVSELSGSFDWITLSPKRHYPPKEIFLKTADEIKIIVDDPKDLEFALAIKNQIIKLTNKKDYDIFGKKFFIQPNWNNKNANYLAIDFVKNNPSWTLSIQTHKYLKLK